MGICRNDVGPQPGAGSTLPWKEIPLQEGLGAKTKHLLVERNSTPGGVWGGILRTIRQAAGSLPSVELDFARGGAAS